MMPIMASTEAAPSTNICADAIDLPGALDLSLDEYTTWQLSRVSRESYREQITKACEVALENCLDLKQIEGMDPDFFVKQDVKIGAARRFVSEVRCWIKEREGSKNHEESLD